MKGVRLRKDKIKKNPGLRSVAKLILNTLWGYFALNTNKTQFKIISKPSEWNQLITTDRFKIKEVFFKQDSETIQVTYKEKSEFHVGNNKNNAILAAFVTCQARLHLYAELKRLGDRVLYFDTDSIIYISRPNEYEPSLGDYLGQFTNELSPTDGNHITEFVSTGPKSYAYKTDKGYTECTLKGITFNHIVEMMITFDKYKDIVLNDQRQVVSVPQLNFLRDKDSWEVRTKESEKKFKFTYDKRVVLTEGPLIYTTLPFGY